MQSLLYLWQRFPVDYQISADELFFRSLAVHISKQKKIYWRLFVSLLEALGSALNVECPPAVVMDLVLAETKPIDIHYLNHKQIAQVARRLWLTFPTIRKLRIFLGTLRPEELLYLTLCFETINSFGATNLGNQLLSTTRGLRA